MKKTIAVVIACAGFSLAAGSVYAADANLVFTGTITDKTCSINGSVSQLEKAVSLPQISTAALATAGNTAGETGFSLELTGCTGTSVQAKFAQGTNVDMTNGNLNNTGTSNVQVQLLNSQHQKIELNNDSGIGQTELLDTTVGTATMQFYAQYYAKADKTVAGTVNTSILVDMLYN